MLMVTYTCSYLFTNVFVFNTSFLQFLLEQAPAQSVVKRESGREFKYCVLHIL